MLAGTGGTTGRPKGVMLTGHNIETMTAITLMSYPFEGRPRYLALAPLTHAAGVLCFPVMTLGGEIVIMPAPDLGEFLALIRRAGVTHTFLPPTLIYMLLGHPELPAADLTSLQCFWYGAAPMSATRLAEAIDDDRAGDGPAVRADRGADDDLDDGPDGALPRRRLDRDRAAVVGRPARARWCRSAIMDDDGRLLAARRARRDRGAQLAGHGRLLQEPGGDRGGLAATAGTTPATSATWTSRATSSSSTAPRT